MAGRFRSGAPESTYPWAPEGTYPSTGKYLSAYTQSTYGNDRHRVAGVMRLSVVAGDSDEVGEGLFS